MRKSTRSEKLAHRRARRRPARRIASLARDAFEVERRAFGRRREHDRAGLVLERVRPARELHPHALLDEADLSARVLVLGEAEAQQALADELGGRPAVGHAPRRFDRETTSVASALRGCARSAARRGGRAGTGPARATPSARQPSSALLVLREAAVRAVDVEQVLALDVEDQRARVGASARRASARPCSVSNSM